MPQHLLVLAPEFFSFVKDQTITIAPHFKSITVLVRHNPIAEISNFFPIHSLAPFRKANLIDCQSVPQNISVIANPVWYAPSDRFYKSLGNLHFKAADRVIARKNLKFDLVHAHATWSSGFAGAKVKEKYGVPLVVTAHGFDIYALPFKDAQWREKIEYVLNAADIIITVSQSNLECIRKLDVRTRAKIIPNGYRSDLFFPRDMIECRKMLGLPTDRKILLSIGNLEMVKGHIYLIEAVKAVLKEDPSLLCIIVGDGSLRAALTDKITSLKIDHHIRFVGRKSHDEIPYWMSACDFFVLPSLNEGNPTVMFEALGCGKPFVGSKVGGVPEIITSKKYGLLVEPSDVTDLSEKISMALATSWDGESIHTYGERYSWEESSKKILSLYTGISD